MPGTVGSLYINSVASSAVIHIGDANKIAPNSALKTFAGAGSFNSGHHMDVNNQYSITYTLDVDQIDTSVIDNGGNND